MKNPLRVSKTGWLVIDDAIKSGWPQTLRLVVVLSVLTIAALSVLLSTIALGGMVADAAVK